MKIYLSHARKDVSLALDLAKALENEGFKVWESEFGVNPGENWAKKLGKALDSSDLIVFLLTPGARTSDLVQNDIDFSLMSKKYAHRVFTIFVGPAKSVKKEVPWILAKLPNRMVESAEEFAEVAKDIQEFCASGAHA